MESVSTTDSDPGRSFTITRRNGDVYTVLVSVEDYDSVIEAGPWCITDGKNRPSYIMRKVMHDGVRRTQFLHRFIAKPTGTLVVDHINRDSMDNRRSNLRIVSQSDNIRNSKLSTANSSGAKGVHRVRGRWGATLHLGVFDSVEEAKAAWRAAAILVRGTDARF